MREEICLNDIFDIGSSKRVFQSEWRESGVPFYRAREIAKLAADGYVDNELFIEEELYEKYIEKYGLPQKGDIMVTGVGTLGVCYIVKDGDRFYFKDGNILWFKQKAKDRVIPEYVVKAFNSKAIKDQIKRNSSGTTVGTFTITTAKKLKLQLPGMEEQRHIVDVLGNLEKIIEKRRKQLNELDDLIKSRFVEMFGDSKENPMSWDEVSVTDILAGKTSNGFFAKRDDYCEHGNVSVLGVANIVNRMYSEVNDLPKTNAADKDIVKYEVKYGDMLFCRSSLVAEGIGKASIVPSNAPKNILFECHVIRIQLDLTKCVPEYLQMLTTTPYFRNQVLRHAKTSTMTTIGQDGIVNNLVILPPIAEQKKYLELVRHVDKLKVEVQKSIDETQELFDSLMQEYFG